jgi:hypothetical protein
MIKLFYKAILNLRYSDLLQAYHDLFNVSKRRIIIILNIDANFQIGSTYRC